MTADWIKTEDELIALCRDKLGGEHDYGTSAEAATEIAYGAFQYAAHVMGLTGFQASYCALDLLRRINAIEGPLAVIKGHDLLYPQYDIRAKVDGYIAEWTDEWARDEARKNLEGDNLEHVHPDVLNHWRELAT